MFQTLLCYVAITCLMLCQLVADNKMYVDGKSELRIEKVLDNYRLPSTVTPENYKLQVTTHLGDKEGFTFKGSVLITVSLLSFSL